MIIRIRKTTSMQGIMHIVTLVQHFYLTKSEYINKQYFFGHSIHDALIYI